jgi:hypothetical protein
MVLNDNSSIMELSFNSVLFNFELRLSYLIIIVLLLLLVLYYIYTHERKIKLDSIQFVFDAKILKCTYNIQRSYENVELAYRIYTELTTRKAAIPIDPYNDVIIEVYDSWYALFKVTREELKSLSGKSLLESNSKELVKMVTEILNLGLRPHLTTYQAKFRKWYEGQLKIHENGNKSPQEIQRDFPEFENLIESMKDVNELLINYSKQLHNFVYKNDSSTSAV